MRDLLLRSLFQKPSPDNLFNCCFLSQVAFGGAKGKGGGGEAAGGCKLSQVWRQPSRMHELTVRQTEEGMCPPKVWLLKDGRVNAIVLHVPVCCLAPLSFSCLTPLKKL